MSKSAAGDLQRLESELQKSEKKLTDLKEELEEQIKNHDQYDDLETQREKLAELNKEFDKLKDPVSQEKEKLKKDIKITKGFISGLEGMINISPEIEKTHQEIANQDKVIERLKVEIKTLKINSPALADLQKEIKPLKIDPLAKANLENALAGKGGAPAKKAQQEMQAELAGFKVSDQAKENLMALKGGTISTPKTKTEQVNNPDIGNKQTEVQAVKNSPQGAKPSLTLADQQRELDRYRTNLNSLEKKNNLLIASLQKGIEQIEKTHEVGENRDKLIESYENKIEDIRLDNKDIQQKKSVTLDSGDLTANQVKLNEARQSVEDMEVSNAEHVQLSLAMLQQVPSQPAANLNPSTGVNDLGVSDFDILEDEERLNALEKKIRELEEPYKRYELIDRLKANLTHLNEEEEAITQRIEELYQTEVDNLDLTATESEELTQLEQDLRNIERAKEQISLAQDEILDKLELEEQLNNTLNEELEKQVIMLRRVTELGAIDLLDITTRQEEELAELEQELEISENKIKDLELQQQNLSKEILVLGNKIMEQEALPQNKSIEELQADLEALSRSFEGEVEPETHQDLKALEERLKKFELEMKQSDLEDKAAELEKDKARLSDNYESLLLQEEDIIEKITELEARDELSEQEIAELNSLESELEECREKLTKATLDLQEIEDNLNIDNNQEVDKNDLGLDLPEEIETKDAVNFGGTTKSQKKENTAELSSSTNSIAADIKEQVIDKQIQAVKAWADTQNIVDDNGNKISELNNTEFSRYLRENSDITEKALSDSNLKSNLEEVEISGYKKVHDMHKDEMSTVEWKQDASEKEVRINPIIKDGVTLCDLVERTSKESLTVTDSSGRQVDITSHRIINFQTHLNDGAEGPLDISMAVKDRNGKNIAESKAVYFTAHYDDSGKLIEVSTPKPIKFLGTGDKAIGYIEHGGEIYTLPVTKGNYDAMMTEVQKNNGIGFDLAETVEKPKAQAKDTVLGLPAKSHEQLQNITKNLDQNKAASVSEKPVVVPVKEQGSGISRK